MSPLSRYVNALFSPGPVFEDIRRSPGAWWFPIVVGSILFAVFACIHIARYDQSQITEQQMKDSVWLKLAPEDQRDKIIDKEVTRVRSIPAWHLQLQYFGWTLFGYTVSVLFFTFLYLLIALMMGWVKDLRASTLFISLGIALAIGLVLGGIAAVAAIAGGAGDPSRPPADWSAILATVGALGGAAGLFALVSRTSRKPAYARAFSAVSYATAPGAVGFLVGILIILMRAPDATPLQEIVPSSLAALLDPRTASKWLLALGSSLDLFSLWSIALTVIGLSKVLDRKTGEAAAIVLIPWGSWVLLKTLFAALTG